MKILVFFVVVVNLFAISKKELRFLYIQFAMPSSYEVPKNLKNPFILHQAKRVIKPQKVQSLPQQKISLEAILNNKALINGKLYQVGDSFNGYKIVKIKDSYIKLSSNGGIKIVKISFDVIFTMVIYFIFSIP